MKNNVVLACDDLHLHSIDHQDLDLLRRWRKASPNAFEPALDEAWFRAYEDGTTSLIFLVEYQRRAVGCVGFDYKDGEIIIHTVLGDKKAPEAAMGKAVTLVTEFAQHRHKAPIKAKVTRADPAIAWLTKAGARLSGESQSHLHMTL